MSAAVVVDNGSGWIKSGFSGLDKPQFVFASLVGEPKAGADGKGICYGDEAQAKCGMLQLRRPIERGGIVTSWDAMEALWRHTYHQMGATPEESAVLSTEPPLNPKQCREKATQMHFETFGVPRFHLCCSATLAS